MFKQYADRLGALVAATDWQHVERLAHAFRTCWEDDRQIFLCGNGGSAGNAVHLANDYLYGCACGVAERGLRVQALSANPATMTCLANDVGYDAIFSLQLETLARPGDLLVVLSGSGNSPNIVAALETARAMNVTTAAVLGYDGGKALALAQFPVHFPISDMQIAEDMQLVVGHMIMQWLRTTPPMLRADLSKPARPKAFTDAP